MKFISALLFVGSASAFAPAQVSQGRSSSVSSSNFGRQTAGSESKIYNIPIRREELQTSSCSQATLSTQNEVEKTMRFMSSSTKRQSESYKGHLELRTFANDSYEHAAWYLANRSNTDSQDVRLKESSVSSPLE